MLSVSPPGPSSFEDYYQTYRAKENSATAVQDAILGAAWDLAPPSLPSSSSSSSSDVELNDDLPTTSPSSESPKEKLTSSGLLIRSKYQGWERSFELHHDWPVPQIEKDDEVLIKNVSIGLNPVDFKSVLYNFGIAGTPWILGRDIAGIVEKVGKDVDDVKPGQRVWLCADSRDVRSGAYQAYSVARRAHLGLISDNVSYEEAATLGTGLVTAAIAAYWFFDWTRAELLGGKVMPRTSRMEVDESDRTTREGRDWVLIYGGGSITGIYLTQLARLSGYKVVTIASPINFDYLTSLGATHCIDRYLEPEEIQEQVLTLVGEEGVAYCMDTVGSKTATICHGILRSAGRNSKGEMICLAGDPKVKSINPTPDRPAKMRRSMAASGSGSKRTPVDPVQDLNRSVTVHKISFSTTFYGDDVFAKSVIKDVDALLHNRQLQPARPEKYPDGLAGVRRGLEALRDNKAPGATKLVVNIQDTPHSHFTNLGVRAELGWNGVA